MKITKEWDWSQLGTGFWLGAAVISIVNIGLILAQHNQLLYNEYLLVVAILIVIIYQVVRSRSP